jgi:hypothetical protein
LQKAAVVSDCEVLFFPSKTLILAERTMKLAILKTEQICGRLDYSVRFGKSTELEESIEKNGILQPVIAYIKGKDHFIVSGSRRLMAAKKYHLAEVPAFLISEKSKAELLCCNIRNDLTSAAPYSPVEKSILFSKIQAFSLSPDQTKLIFRDLGIPFTHQSTSLLSRIRRLTGSVRKWLHQKKFPFNLLNFLTILSPEDLDILAKSIFIPFDTNANETQALSFLFHDVSTRDNKPLSHFVSSALRSVHPENNKRNNLTILQDHIFKLRYPIYSCFENKTNKESSSFHLPGFMNVNVPVSADPENFTFSAKISEERDIRSLFHWFRKNKNEEKLVSFLKSIKKAR